MISQWFRSAFNEHALAERVVASAHWLRNQLHASKLDERKRLLTNLRNLLATDPLLRLDDFSGIFAMDVRSDLFRRLIVTGEYESRIKNCCLQHLDRNRDVIDVGANIGFYTVLFSRQLYCSKVLAIEPTKNAYERLLRNIKHNGVCDRVIVFNGVAAEYNEIMDINVIEGKEEYSSIGKMTHPSIVGQSYSKHPVSASSIDCLVNNHNLDPGFIKIDVEGCEHMVLSGCQETLQVHRPVIISELSDPLLRRNGTSSREVINMIRKHNYRILDPLFPEKEPGTRRYGDILCIPLGRG